MRTSFHHQPEAQHPKSPAIYTPAGRLPHLLSSSGQHIAVPLTKKLPGFYCTGIAKGWPFSAIMQLRTFAVTDVLVFLA